MVTPALHACPHVVVQFRLLIRCLRIRIRATGGAVAVVGAVSRGVGVKIGRELQPVGQRSIVAFGVPQARCLVRGHKRLPATGVAFLFACFAIRTLAGALGALFA